MAHMGLEEGGSNHWDYRLVRGADMLWLIECYYDEHDVIWGWAEEHIILGENMAVVAEQIEMFKDALAKPILDVADLPRGDKLLPITHDELMARLEQGRR